MKQVVATGIVLARTDFGEADRILTILTRDQGKIKAIAKGVRKIKSKLAGGIELFSISQITFIQGKSEIYTLTSTRLDKHYGQIVSDINRTMYAYEVLKQINRVTEANTEEAYFDLLQTILGALNDINLSLAIIQFWFTLQLLHITGHVPNLRTDAIGKNLSTNSKYEFDHNSMAFEVTQHGTFSANHIKLMSLGIRANQPAILAKVQQADKLLRSLLPLVRTILSHSVRV